MAEPDAKILSQEETVALIGPMLSTSGTEYRKFKQAFIRKAEPNEKVQTILQGKVETENVASEGDMVVRADTSSKEEYILKAETFQKFYCDAAPIDAAHPDAAELQRLGFQAYRPNRRLKAVEVDAALAAKFEGGRFMAAWGEPMCVEVGDFLGSGQVAEDGRVLEVIRIERKSFFETYEACP